MTEENDVSCTVCNVIEIGTVIRESDNVTAMKLRGDSQKERVQTLITLAKAVESEPCTITSTTGEDGNEELTIAFSCAAEKLIFEMRARQVL